MVMNLENSTLGYGFTQDTYLGTSVTSLRTQMTSDYDSAWYGTYKVALDEPEPTNNSSYWPPEIYVSRPPPTPTTHTSPSTNSKLTPGFPGI